jgi:hypothetical protein
MQPSFPSNPSKLDDTVSHARRKPLLWTGVGLAAIVLSFGGYTLVQWFANGQSRTSLEFATTLQQQGNHQGCINQAALVSTESALYRQANAIRQSCQLSQANALAQQNNLTEAVRLLGTAPADSPLNSSVQMALDDWSRMLLDRAAAEYDMGNREAAFAMLRTIPANSAAHAEATEKLDQWTQEWAMNADRLQTIRRVLQVNDLQSAFAELQQVTTLHWRLMLSS